MADQAPVAAPATVVRFTFEDLARRTFLALNRAGDAYHHVHPVDETDIRAAGWWRDGELVVEPKVAPGDLVCECASGRMRSTCYVVEAAKRRLEEQVIDFSDPSLGAGASVEAARG